MKNSWNRLLNLLIVLLIAILVVSLIGFVVFFQPSLEVGRSVLILETQAGSLSVQSPQGQWSAWLTTPRCELRLWPRD